MSLWLHTIPGWIALIVSIIAFQIIIGSCIGRLLKERSLPIEPEIQQPESESLPELDMDTPDPLIEEFEKLKAQHDDRERAAHPERFGVSWVGPRDERGHDEPH